MAWWPAGTCLAAGLYGFGAPGGILRVQKSTYIVILHLGVITPGGTVIYKSAPMSCPRGVLLVSIFGDDQPRCVRGGAPRPRLTRGAGLGFSPRFFPKSSPPFAAKSQGRLHTNEIPL